MAKYIFINNEIVPEEKAFLHVSDLAVHRGYGIFDFFKISNDHVFFIDDYLDRFYHSAQLMRLTVPLQREEIKSVIFELINKNNLPESGIKMILTGGYSTDGYQPSTPNMIFVQSNLTLPGPEQIENGIKIITHEYVRDLPAAKTINYITGVWLLEKMKEQNAADVLYHINGAVSEFPRCNFFIVKNDNTVVTPRDNVLFGITRKNVLKLASKKYNVLEDTIHLNDIFEAREAFLTSTTKRILPVVQVNENPVGNGMPGPVTFSLLEDLKQLELEELSNKPKVIF